jgi:hypothetical protein
MEYGSSRWQIGNREALLRRLGREQGFMGTTYAPCVWAGKSIEGAKLICKRMFLTDK